MTHLPQNWRDDFDVSVLLAEEERRKAECEHRPYRGAEDFADEYRALVESPIEIALAWSIVCHPVLNETGFDVFLWSAAGLDARDCRSCFDEYREETGCYRVFGPRMRTVLFPQVVLGRYRVDFLAIAGCDWRPVPGPVTFVVECDGHDSHERNRRQAARDKERDRLMAIWGQHVLRFTGSEIWRDGATCAEQVWQFVRSHT